MHIITIDNISAVIMYSNYSLSSAEKSSNHIHFASTRPMTDLNCLFNSNCAPNRVAVSISVC